MALRLALTTPTRIALGAYHKHESRAISFWLTDVPTVFAYIGRATTDTMQI